MLAADTQMTMAMAVFTLLLTALAAAATVKTWRRSLAWVASRRAGLWPWSERSWLGVMAGQAVSPIWFLSGGVMIATTGTIADAALVVLCVSTVLQGTLFLLGVPSFLMPPAFRGSFRGWLRWLSDG